jgi:hypothetical protein
VATRAEWGSTTPLGTPAEVGTVQVYFRSYLYRSGRSLCPYPEPTDLDPTIMTKNLYKLKKKNLLKSGQICCVGTGRYFLKKLSKVLLRSRYVLGVGSGTGLASKTLLIRNTLIKKQSLLQV